jgi:hypothetical protein
LLIEFEPVVADRIRSRAEPRRVFRRYLAAFIKMADACRHIDTTAEHVAAMLGSPDVDVVIALWRDPDAPGGIGVWVVKGLPVLEAVVDRGSIATLPMIAFWLRDREHALAIEAQVAGSTH